MIALDTSALLAGIDETDPHHRSVLAVSHAARGPLVLPVPTLAEATYLIEQSLGARLLEAFLRSVINDEFALDCCEQDFVRVLELVSRYGDLPLGFADAAVIACAERRGGRVLTLDHRHFNVVAREGTIQVLP